MLFTGNPSFRTQLALSRASSLIFLQSRDMQLFATSMTLLQVYTP